MLRRLLSRKTLAITAVVLAALVAIFYAEENWRGRRAWENYRAAAEKRGVKLFMKDMIPPDVPDSENYAAIPLIREMFSGKKPGQNSSAPFSLPTPNRPKLASFATGRGVEFQVWQQFLAANELLGEKTADAPRDVIRALEKFEPALQELRDASPRPRSKFPTGWKKGLEADLPHISPLMAAGLLFSLRMEALLAAGDRSAALSEFHHAMRLREALGSEPSFIVSLVRIHNLAVLESAVWSGLVSHRWTEDDLNALEKQFASPHLLDEFQFAVESERGGPIEAIFNLTTKTSKLPAGWIFQNVLLMHEGIDAFLAPYHSAAESGKPMTMKDAISMDEWLQKRKVFSGLNRYYYTFVGMAMPALDRAQRRSFFHHTALQQTLLGCALERYRLKHQAFPEKLDQLVPEFIAEVPCDVADGKPLRYRLNADGGYDLWSIGPDGKDDGGKIDPKKEGDQQADWIWHMPGRASAP